MSHLEFPPLGANSFIRTAGPPAELGTVVVWTFVAVAAFGSLLFLPQLARRSNLSKEHMTLQAIQDQIASASNDIRSAAYHFWRCTALIIAYDVIMRIVSLVLLSPRQLFIQQFFPLVAANQTFYCNSIDALNSCRAAFGTGRIPHCNEMPEEVPGLLASLALQRTVDPFNEATKQATFFVDQIWVAFISALILLSIVSYHQFHTHTRLYFLNQLPEQQPLPASHGFVARRQPIVVNTFYLMAIWLLVFLTAFGYKRAMPVVMAVIYPAAICISGAFSMMVS